MHESLEGFIVHPFRPRDSLQELFDHLHLAVFLRALFRLGELEGRQGILVVGLSEDIYE